MKRYEHATTSQNVGEEREVHDGFGSAAYKVFPVMPKPPDEEPGWRIVGYHSMGARWGMIMWEREIET